MEGVGSRLGRASSRYGPAATVFNGPVRKWKKKWVHVSSSSSSSTLNAYNHNPQSQSNGTPTPRLLLCRWTPATATSAAAADGSGGTQLEEPPRRKFRYTPIAVLEEQKRIAEKKVEDEEKTNEMVDQLTTGPTTMSDEKHEKPNIDDVLKEENNVTEMNGVQDSDLSILDLGLGLNSPNDNLDDIETKESQTEKTSSSTLLSMDEAA
ncbi:hypothetical protein F8388_020395 [Cannabis sativa]|uniref:Uncharacterized protein n=1 Tax=Cannabis sativa TaxID=3483 RepID=A0A7J6HJD1_CANSA|nr:hypothetical protein G4B88_005630 [Cannabis sativa]KAF4394570.1 hypothetical protein F8388_020395 [Cannabis sativa]KAF4395920.1 hypothetical protein G4B88_028090 [Cannabis sativa]